MDACEAVCQTAGSSSEQQQQQLPVAKTQPTTFSPRLSKHFNFCAITRNQAGSVPPKLKKEAQQVIEWCAKSEGMPSTGTVDTVDEHRPCYILPCVKTRHLVTTQHVRQVHVMLQECLGKLAHVRLLYLFMLTKMTECFGELCPEAQLTFTCRT